MNVYSIEIVYVYFLGEIVFDTNKRYLIFKKPLLCKCSWKKLAKSRKESRLIGKCYRLQL